MEYIIVADYNFGTKVSECLVCLAGHSLESAAQTLQEVQTTERGARLLQGGTNPRIKEVNSKDAWWNKGSLD